jgi:hypothetical protein
LALADRAADRGAGVRHQEAEEHRLDLGGAVKGFKDGMKDGSAPETAGAAGQPGHAPRRPGADKTTIDVEARNKS